MEIYNHYGTYLVVNSHDFAGMQNCNSGHWIEWKRFKHFFLK